MGDSVKEVCLVCTKAPAPIEIINGKRKRKSHEEFMDSFRNHLFIGRGIESTQNRLPGYCRSCQKIFSTKAEDPYCGSCNSLLQLCGDFIIQHRNTPPSGNFYCYPLEILVDNPFGLTIENIVKNSNLSEPQQELFKINPDILEEFDLVFKINYDKKYPCPKCKTENLKINMAFISWD